MPDDIPVSAQYGPTPPPKVESAPVPKPQTGTIQYQTERGAMARETYKEGHLVSAEVSKSQEEAPRLARIQEKPKPERPKEIQKQEKEYRKPSVLEKRIRKAIHRVPRRTTFKPRRTVVSLSSFEYEELLHLRRNRRQLSSTSLTRLRELEGRYRKLPSSRKRELAHWLPVAKRIPKRLTA